MRSRYHCKWTVLPGYATFTTGESSPDTRPGVPPVLDEMGTARMSLKMRFVRLMVKSMSRGMFDGDEINAPQLRETLKKAYGAHTVEKGVRLEVAELGGVEIAFYCPENPSSDDIIYYLHGGGFITGDRFTAGPYASELALRQAAGSWPRRTGSRPSTPSLRASMSPSPCTQNS